MKILDLQAIIRGKIKLYLTHILFNTFNFDSIKYLL